MSVSETLQELARQVRRNTIRVLDEAESTWLTFAPRGTSNHILWHAGHAVWLQDILCVALLTGQGEIPAGWSDAFGMNCRPVSETLDWPSRTALRERLESQLSRIVTLLTETPASRFAETANPSRGPQTIRDRIIHGFHDEAKHNGEMYLLLKLCRAKS